MALNVGLVGFGTVGKSVARLITERHDGLLHLTHVCSRDVARRRVDWLPSEVCWTDRFEDLLTAPIDAVVELIGGLEPAADWVSRALEAGKAVVTANKQLVATRGGALLALACQHRTELAFEAAVGGGIPIIRGLRDGIAGDRIRSIVGILNGTCNFILTRMEHGGVSYAAALREAQERGYAEADPSEDVDGDDARAKLSILARVGLGLELEPSQLRAQSIRPLDHVDFTYARRLESTIRQVSRVALRDNAGEQIEARVGPALVPLSSPLAAIVGSRNIVVTTGDYGSETLFAGHGAGGNPTAVAVVSDLVALARHGARWVDVCPHGAKRTSIVSDAPSPHYLRLVVNDRPGIIAGLAGVLSAHDINIDAVLQEPGNPKSALPFVVTLESCPESTMRRAVEEIAALDFNVQPPLCLPML
ncbi:MAG: homoserine dehydrogenase [Luteitalea sp.]|nr:homoserine dehydrogenase [Luteitalea sp.]